jgi:hypothetical protein
MERIRESFVLGSKVSAIRSKLTTNAQRTGHVIAGGGRERERELVRVRVGERVRM